jgi:hypothetical protein
LEILRYLSSNRLNPENYFIDSSGHKTGDTLHIQVWDFVGLQTIIRYENRNDSSGKVSNTAMSRGLKFPKPIGNPGNCFTAYFDTKNNILIAIELWQ